MIKLIKRTYPLRSWKVRCWKELAVLLLLSGNFGLLMAQSLGFWSDFEKDLPSLERHLSEWDQDPHISGAERSEWLRSGYDYFSRNLNAEGQAFILYSMGIGYARESMLSAAIDVHEHALEIYRDLKLDAKIAQVQMMLGTNYGRRGDYDQATSRLLASLALFKELDNQQGMADVLLKLGTVQSYLGQLDIALEYFFEALEKSEAHLPGNVVTLYGNIAFIYMEQGDFDQSELYFRKALDYKGETETLRPQTLALINLGQMYKLKGDLVQSNFYLNQALQMA